MSTEAVSAPAAEAPVVAPEAVETQKPVSVGDEVNAVEKAKTEAKEPEKKPSLRDSITKAREKVEAEQKAEKPTEGAKGDDKGKPEAKAAEKPEAKPVEKTAQERDETGKFKGAAAETPAEQPKAKAPHDDAPKRFDDAAKAEWAKAPESVRGAVHRTVTELEKGIEEHQKRWEPIKPYHELAEQHGAKLHEALERYVAFDQHLSQDIFAGLEGVIRDKTGGQYGLRDIAAQVMGQQPNQAQSQNDATIADLRGQLARLEKMVGGLGGHMRQQADQSIGEQIVSFAADKTDFEDLAPKIAEHIRAGKSLEEAYTQAKTDMEEMATRLGFVRPSAPAQTRTEQIPDPAEAQTLERGSKSIAGAPGAGSIPAVRPPSSSIRDAVRRAMQTAQGV